MLADVQALLVRVLTAEDPRGALARELASATSLTAEERAWLVGVDPDGLALSSLLVDKLRFQQLLRGVPGLAEEFERDPEAVVATVARYVREVPCTTFFPEREGQRFQGWYDARKREPPRGSQP